MRGARTLGGKLRPPADPAWFVRRPALESVLDEATQRRLTTVVAGPGFGKSTLLGAWAAEREAAWYTLGPSDERLSAIAAGLVDAVWPQDSAPAPLTAALGALAQSSSEERRQAEAFGAALCQALEESLDAELVIVLDDVHEVAKTSVGATAIASVCRHLPPGVHLILSSRNDPPFAIERYRGRGEIATIDAERLAFSVDEIVTLLTAAIDDTAVDLASALFDITGGWPAGVRLATEALRDVAGSERLERLERFRRRGGVLFDYLAEEVFAREPPRVREFLRRVAPLERFTADLCEALGLLGSAATIARLVGRGLFVQTQGDWLTLHSLVRRFALEAWPLAPDEAEALHRRAAAWFEEHGFVEETLLSIAAFEDRAELARVLMDGGRALLRSGAASSVLRFVEMIPDDIRTPDIETLAGRASIVSGDLDGALVFYGKAVAGSGPLPARVVWPLVTVLCQRDQLHEAVEFFERASFDGSDPGHQAALLAWMGVVFYYLGDVPASRAVADRARASVPVDPDAFTEYCAEMGVAIPYMLEGQLAGAFSHVTRAMRVLPAAADAKIIAAQLLIYQGDYERAISTLDEVMRLGDLVGGDARAFPLVWRGQALFRGGRLDEAMADFETAAAIAQRARLRELAYAAVGKGGVLIERGALAQARIALEQAVDHGERTGNREVLVPALYQLARAIAGDDPERAAVLAARAIEPAFPPLQSAALVAAGWVAHLAGDLEGAADAAEDAERISHARGDPFSVAESLELSAFATGDDEKRRALLEEALAIWRRLRNLIRATTVELAIARTSDDASSRAARDRAERRLHELGVRNTKAPAAGLLRVLALGRDEPVSICSLGGFEVLRNGQPVPASEWQSKKARDLLKILVARRGRPVSRDLLLDALWPDDDPVRTSRRLSVALVTARTVLDPERRFRSDELIIGDNETLKIDVDKVPVDVEAFFAEANDALEGAGRGGKSGDVAIMLASAEARYAGDFLEDDPYSDWAIPLREEARSTYIDVCRALIAVLKGKGDEDGAMRYLRRVLDRDPYDEESNLHLVTTLVARGHHGEALRRYRAYVARMEEIGAEAMPFPSPEAPHSGP